MVQVSNPPEIQLVRQFQEVRQRSLDLCKPLKTEDYIPQSAVFASPPKWHLGHTTWFFEELLLKKYLPGYQVFDDQFAYAFNSYYNHLGDRVNRADRGLMTRPTVSEVLAYRNYVDEAITRWIQNHPIAKEQQDLLTLGLNHEQQHQELLITDLKYTLSINPLYPVYDPNFSLCQNSVEASNEWITIPEGVYHIGHEGDGFCYDNELGRHKVFLHSYQLKNTLVTNAEYKAFMEDGGYQRFELWLDEGWSWVNQHQITQPLYWKQQNGEWFHYTLKGLLPINGNDILCHINFYEADAFARWKGMRLPTEFEWEVASCQLRWGTRWEWTNSAYLPYPFFKTAGGAIGEYNGKFMINQMVLRGASTATAPAHSRPTYRNFFHPHYRWQVTGIRLAK